MQHKIKVNESIHQLPTMVVLPCQKHETEIEFDGTLCEGKILLSRY
jgi:hypothetical protein